MTYSEFKSEIIKNAKAAGLDEYDLYYSKGLATEVQAFDGEIRDFSDKTSLGVCFRCIIGGKIGYSHTQKLDADEAKRLVANAQSCAGIIENSEFAVIFGGSESYRELPRAAESSCDAFLLKETALNIERSAKAKDKRIFSVDYAISSFEYGETALYNSRGLDLSGSRSSYSLFCYAVAEEDGHKYIGFDFDVLRSASVEKFYESVEKITGSAVDMAIGSIGGKSVKSGEYKIIFSNSMMIEMLGAFRDIFSGDAVQKGLSLLGGKEGQEIASDTVTLTDDPFFPDSYFNTAFDGEGVATYTKNIVENGVLKTLLYDLKSAAKSGRESTGNGMKGSYASSVAVSPINLYIRPGRASKEEILALAGDGLYITELKGIHASADPTTGDFSLESKGYLVENGKISRPAEQFTIAGNFYAMLKNIACVGNDLRMNANVGAPTVLVSALSVAGE
jgi:PmbA protein